MQMIDILAVVGDYQTVTVYNTEFDLIGRYDGKNSINEAYNNAVVVQLAAVGDELKVFIQA